jgi:hypothetical protein
MNYSETYPVVNRFGYLEGMGRLECELVRDSGYEWYKIKGFEPRGSLHTDISAVKPDTPVILVLDKKIHLVRNLWIYRGPEDVFSYIKGFLKHSRFFTFYAADNMKIIAEELEVSDYII